MCCHLGCGEDRVQEWRGRVQRAGAEPCWTMWTRTRSGLWKEPGSLTQRRLSASPGPLMLILLYEAEILFV